MYLNIDSVNTFMQQSTQVINEFNCDVDRT